MTKNNEINLELKKTKYDSEIEILKYLNKLNIDDLYIFKNYLDDLYYNEVTDIEDWKYDLIKENLQKRNLNYKTTIGSKIRDSDNKVKLSYWLGSMDKYKPENTKPIKNWFKKIPNSNSIIIESKLDGISCLFISKNNHIKLYTRGDGIEGSDITHILPFIKLGNIQNLKDIDISIRGELIIKKSIFEEKYKDEFSNPRNMVSGLVNSKTLKEGLSDLSFVTYEIIGNATMDKPEIQLKYLHKLGFNVVYYEIYNVDDILDENIIISDLIEYLIDFKSISEYEIDGIIVQYNTNYVRNISGNPKYAFAFKILSNENIIQTKVIDVKWNLSKYGIFKPIVVVEPVKIGGTIISRVTGHNAKYIVYKKIGLDTIINITRAGDVIPYIVNIVEPTIALLPNEKYKWNETNVNIMIDNENGEVNKKVCIKSITNFFDKIGVKSVKEQTIEKIYDYGLDDLIKIIKTKESTFLEIPGFGKRKAEIVYNNIHNSLKNVPIYILLSATGIFGIGIGSKKLQELFEYIPNILELVKDNTISKTELYNKIMEVKGFSDKTTNKIIGELDTSNKFLEELKDYISIKKEEKHDKDEEHKLFGKKIVFTGFRDKSLSQKIEELGGKEMSTISKNIDLLIIKNENDKETSKIKKAIELGIIILTKDEFVKIVNT
jgi:DNA ligase (NAD+)